MKVTTLATMIVAFASTSVSQAAVITIDPANVSSSSEIGAPFNRQNDFIVDGSGLTGGQHTTAVQPNMWLSMGTCCGGVEDTDPWWSLILGRFTPSLASTFGITTRIPRT